MGTLGQFDAELRERAWFDPELVIEGWFDREMVHSVAGISAVPRAWVVFIGLIVLPILLAVA